MWRIVRGESRKDSPFPEVLDRLIAAIIILLTLLFILYPILCVIGASFFYKGEFTLQFYNNLFSSQKKLLLNSLFISTVSAAVSTALAVILALTISLVLQRRQKLLMGVLMLTMISPPLVSSIAYIQLFGRRGLITHSLLQLSYNPYGWHGIVAMQCLSFAPLAALLLCGILAKMDRSLLQASMDLGANPAQTLWRVVIPMLKPALLVCFLLSFVRSLSDFGTPMVIGGAFNVLATEIYMRIIAYGELEAAAAMNVVILIPAMVLFVLYRVLMKKYSLFTNGTNNKIQTTESIFRLNGTVKWTLVVVSMLFFTTMLLQYFTIFLSGVTKTSHGKLQFTLEHFDYLKMYSGSTFVRSVVYGLIVGVVGTVFGNLLAYYTERRKIFGMKLLDFVATLPYIIPGTFFGIGYILAFNKAPLELTGTAAIVVLNCMFRQLPATTKAGSAALSQVSIRLEEAARDLGAGKLQVIRDVIFPNIRPALVVGFINSFTSTMTTIGAIIFLIYPGQKVATLSLFDAVNSGEYGVGALIATILIIITVAVNVGFSKLVLRKGA